MAVFITDTLGLGLRRIIVWSLLLVFGCIDYTHAALGTVTIKAADNPVTNTRIWKVAKGGSKELTCAASGTSVEFRFLHGTTELGTDFSATATHTVSEFNATKAGEYTCKARESGAQGTVATSDIALTLALTCSANGGECGDADVYKCDTTAAALYCKCEINNGPAKDFPAQCELCKDGEVQKYCGDHASCSGTPKTCKCTYGGKAKTCDECSEPSDCGDHAACGGSPKACTCPYGGTAPKACNACNGTTHLGCKADSKTPRCDAAAKPPKCDKCNDEFCKTIKGKEVCDAKEGNCKAKGKTSDATTVTSTVSMCIASVVVALMI